MTTDTPAATAELPLHARVKGAAAWRPEKNAILAGHVVSVARRESEYGAYPLLLIEDGDGELHTVHAFHTVLKDELKHLRPGPGDPIEIVYLGKQDSAKRKDADGRPVGTHIYSVSDGMGTNDIQAGSWDDFEAGEVAGF